MSSKLYCTSIAVAVMLVVVASATQPPVKIGFINPVTNGGSFATFVNTFLDGCKMVFDAVNTNGGIPNRDGSPSGRMIDLVSLDNQGNTSHGPVVLDAALRGNHSDMLALMLTIASRYTVPLEPVLTQHNLSIIGPITGESLYYNTYDPRFINIAPSADSELLGLLRFLVVIKKLKRIALLQPQNLAYGQSQKEFAVKLLKQLGMELVDVFLLDHPTRTFATELAELVAAKPQGILYYGPLTASSGQALGALIQTFPTMVIALPVAATAILDSVLQTLPSSVVNDRLYAGGYAPHHRETKYKVVRSFLAAAAATPSLNYPLAAINAYDVIGSLSFLGYLHARFLLKLLSQNVNVTDRIQFRDQLLDSTMVPIDDVFYGVFSGVCTDERVSLCECNNGAHSVYFNKIEANRSYTPQPQETLTTPIETCREENLKIPSPLLQLQVLDTESGVNLDAARLISDSNVGSAAAYGLTPIALVAAANSVVDSSVKYPVLDHVFRSSDYETENPVHSLASEYTLTVIAGSLSKYGVQNSSAMRQSSSNSTPLSISTVDDITIIPYRTASFAAHNIRITSTKEQDIHALASYAAATSLRFGLLSSMSIPDAPYFMDALRRSATTFGAEVGVTESVSTSSSLTENPVSRRLRSLTTTGVILVLGFELSVNGSVANMDDASTAVGEFLNTNPTARVALPLSTLLMAYSHLIASLTQVQLQRVLIATNLPRWGSPRSNSTESNATDFDFSSLSESSTYFTTVPAASRSPAVMWHYITQKFINSVVERVSGALNSATLLSNIYLISSFVVEEGLTVGPFYKRICGPNEVPGIDSCETNVGARQIYVYTLAGAMSTTSAASDATVKPVFQINLPSAAIAYTTPSDQTTSIPITLIVVGSVIGGVLLIVLIAGLIFFLCCVGRRNSAAPKDDTKPFTIAFTDIQSSTSLWAEIPEVMAPSLDIHHTTIRNLVSKFDGYEVKTIGDSFMVAFTSSTRALQFALAIQTTFHSDIKWPGNGAIDTMYIQFDEIKMAALRDQSPTEITMRDMSKLSIKLDSEAYHSAWNGLRVRVGIHCGFGEIKKDPVSNGYDYYGTVVNTAARVESVAHGGQVVTTRDVIEAIIKEGNADELGVEVPNDHCPITVSSLTYFSLGHVLLRGVPQPVPLYQFNNFPQRQFPSLRIEEAEDIDEDDAMEGNDPVFDDLISLTSSGSPLGNYHSGNFQSGVLESSQRSRLSGVAPRSLPKPNSDTQISEDRVKQIYNKRIDTIIGNGNTFLDTLFSALSGPSRESIIKSLCEKWRIKLASKEKFTPVHQARLNKVREALAVSTATTAHGDTRSLGSRNDFQIRKLQQYLLDNADLDVAFKCYQHQAISKRIAPVFAAKEDKLNKKPAQVNNPPRRQSSVLFIPDNNGSHVDFGLDYAADNDFNPNNAIHDSNVVFSPSEYHDSVRDCHDNTSHPEHTLLRPNSTTS